MCESCPPHLSDFARHVFYFENHFFNRKEKRTTMTTQDNMIDVSALLLEVEANEDNGLGLITDMPTRLKTEESFINGMASVGECFLL